MSKSETKNLIKRLSKNSEYYVKHAKERANRKRQSLDSKIEKLQSDISRIERENEEDVDGVKKLSDLHNTLRDTHTVIDHDHIKHVKDDIQKDIQDVNENIQKLEITIKKREKILHTLRHTLDVEEEKRTKALQSSQKIHHMEKHAKKIRT